jgi:hypothetical protein
MSLQLAAQHLSSQGRGKDSTLVHMSPREVSSLNAIAKAHGGQLSINPSTGLPEAGFLESLLPMAAGFALNAAVPGLGAAMGGFAVPALVGGGMTLMTGSLEKGLMAGLGAYGGANLGASLAQTGVEAAAATAPEIAAAQANAATQMQNFYDPTTQAFKPGGLEAVQKASMDASNAYANAQTGAQAAYDKLGFMDKIKSNFGTLTSPGGAGNLFDKISSSPMSLLKTVGSAAAPAIGEAMKPKEEEETKADADMGQRYGFSMNPTGGQQAQQAQPGQNPLSNTPTPTTTPFPTPDIYGREQRYFSPSYSKFTPEQAKSTYGYADGGVATDPDRPTETPALLAFKQMQAQRAAQPPAPQIDAVSQFNQYAQQTVGAPNQMQAPTMPAPTATSLASSGYSYDPIKQQYGQIQGSLEDEEEKKKKSTPNNTYGSSPNPMARGQLFAMAKGGGISHLGDYSDGGRLLRGPGDGVSDSIPAMIGKRQPARLADGEFVVPARIVSELGNGSTEAGARKLYAMMDRIQKARGKTVGKGKVAKNSRSDKYLPA